MGKDRGLARDRRDQGSPPQNPVDSLTLTIRQTSHRNGITPTRSRGKRAGANRMPVGAGFPRKQKPAVMRWIG
jgi:hypothetical protein